VGTHHIIWMLNVMKLLRMISLLAHVSRFVAPTFSAGTAWPAVVSSETVKQLIGEACHNELQQREKRTLWSYVAERRSNNHVFREQVIETVDAPVRHLLAVDGYPPTSSQMKEESDRNQELLNNASRRHALQKQQDDDDKKMEELLLIIPEAFVFEDQGPEGQSERIAFHPNPGFQPKTYEQRVLHVLDGTVLVDLGDKRIVRLSGSLKAPVEFGYGLIGHVQQGGTTDIKRVHLSPGVWKTSAEKINIDGRFVILKTINKHQDETRTGFEPVLSGTTFAQALNKTEDK
jgi:hypothetical protein